MSPQKLLQHVFLLSRSEGILLLSESLRVVPRVLVENVPLAAVLVRNARLQWVVGVGLDEQLAHGLEHLGELGRGLPVLGLEGRDANVARAIISHVGVVDACMEGHEGRLEGVVVGQLDDEAESAAAVGGVVGPCEEDVPGLEVGFGREGDG